MITHLSTWVRDNLDLPVDVQVKIVASILILALLWLMRFLVLRYVFSKTEDVRLRYRWRKGMSYTTSTLGILFIGGLWMKAMESIGMFLGLLSAGLTIALKDLVTGMAGWLFILWRRPFEVGDRIQIGEHRGDVIDIRLFEFILMEIGNWVDSDQSTGRIIRVPNGRVLHETIANYSKGFQFIWNEIPVLITFESDWRLAKNILQRLADKHAEQLTEEAERRVKQAAQRFMIFYNNLSPIVYTTVRDSGVLLTIRYLCQPRHRRGSEQAIWEDILEEFHQHPHLDFAYPTTRFFTGEPYPSDSAGDQARARP